MVTVDDDGQRFDSAIDCVIAQPFLLYDQVRDPGSAEHYYIREVLDLAPGAVTAGSELGDVRAFVGVEASVRRRVGPSNHRATEGESTGSRAMTKHVILFLAVARATDACRREIRWSDRSGSTP